MINTGNPLGAQKRKGFLNTDKIQVLNETYGEYFFKQHGKMIRRISEILGDNG